MSDFVKFVLLVLGWSFVFYVFWLVVGFFGLITGIMCFYIKLEDRRQLFLSCECLTCITLKEIAVSLVLYGSLSS